MLLQALDITLHIAHSGLVLFMIFGGFSRPLVKYHFPIVIIIWLSWLGLGLYMGYIGYCPLTDWHWQVLRQMGKSGLPPSYIEYVYTAITGQDVDNNLMQTIIASVMLTITLCSAFRYFRYKTSKQKRTIK